MANDIMREINRRLNMINILPDDQGPPYEVEEDEKIIDILDESEDATHIKKCLYLMISIHKEMERLQEKRGQNYRGGFEEYQQFQHYSALLIAINNTLPGLVSSCIRYYLCKKI